MANATPTTPATLTAQQVAARNVQRKAKTGPGVTQHSSGAPIAGLAAQPQLAKPQRRMCAVVTAMGTHPGKAACFKRWHLYKVGTTLLQARATAGQTPNDLTFWAAQGYLTLTPATEAQYAAIVAAWQAAQPAKPAAA